MSLSALTLRAAEESHHEVNQAISWGVGAFALLVLFGMLFALVVFGGGREHS